MSKRARLFTSLVCAATPALLLLRWGMAAPLEVPTSFLERFDTVGKWRAVADIELDEMTIAQIEPDTYSFRVYTAPRRTNVALYVGVYAGRAGFGKGAHDPETCLPAQGWEIIASSTKTIPVSEGDELVALALEAQRGSETQSVLYWYQPAARWPRGIAAEEFLRIIDALMGRPQYAFVQLTATRSSGSDVVPDLAEFAQSIAPVLRERMDFLGEEGHRLASFARSVDGPSPSNPGRI